MSDGHATADLELSTSDTAVPSRADKTHVPEPSAATLIQDGSTKGSEPATGQTFVVESPPAHQNGRDAAPAESQTLIATPDGGANETDGDYRFGATVVADGAAGQDHDFGATLVGENIGVGNGDEFHMGATIAGGDDPAARATRVADVVNSLDPAGPAGEFELQPGESLIGRFRVLKVLGEGSFGAVYLAEDPQLDRRVAIKVTKVGVLTTRSDVDRFQREAKAAAQLRHPNIVPVYEVGRIGRSSFLAYEFIDGHTLGSRLKEAKKLPAREAAQMMHAISGALGYAHELGIIHRDMKPDNVLVDKHGQPHIADFGLARRDSGEMDKTREGGLMGTPLYMSPEQASGRSHEADARADVWSLGVMLREMLTGVLPFQGKLTEILIGIQTTEPPSIRTLDPSLPKDLETICQKCLSKDPALRYANGTELAAELDRYLRGEPILARPLSMPARLVRWAKRNPLYASLIAGIFAALSIGIVVSSYFGYKANRNAEIIREKSIENSLALLQSLKTAAPGGVPNALEFLAKVRDDIAGQLDIELAEDGTIPEQRNRLLLAKARLSPHAPGHDERLHEAAQTLVSLSPEEVLTEVVVIKPYAEAIVPTLLDIAHDRGRPQPERRNALYALANIAPELPTWEKDAAEVGAALLAARADLPYRLTLVGPIRERVGKAIDAQFTASESGIQAANVLASLFADQPVKIYTEFVRRASYAQLRPLIEPLIGQGSQVTELATADFLNAPASDGNLRDVLQRRANAFMVLYAVSPKTAPWEALAGGTDNSLRTEIVQGLPQAVAQWQIAAERLKSEPNPLVRQALLEILAQFPVTDMTPENRAVVRAEVLQLLESDQSPAVHSAARWFLQRTGGESDLRKGVERPLLLTERGSRDWFRNSLGQEFAIVRGPVEFQMGAQPEDEEKNFDGRERQHLRRIPRSFAVGMREVSVAEFRQLDQELEFDESISPEPLCPINSVSWIDAAKYCRRLSEAEGVPEEEMVFPPVDQIQPQLQLPADALNRTGYRLPTAAEWEYVCRAGATTSRPFGQPDRIEEFAWFNQNSKGRTWPTGVKQPNSLGMFDTLGNVWEWCQDWYFDKYPTAAEGEAVIDGADPREGFEREGRGGSYADGVAQLRTSDRDNPLPDERVMYFGFRLARTIRE